MHVKSVESSIILPLVWCDRSEKWCQHRCRPRHLAMVQNDEVPRVAEQCDVNIRSLTQPSGNDSQVVKSLHSNACKCIMPLRHGITINSYRAANPLVRLLEGKERWEAPGHLKGFLPLNWGVAEQNPTVTCMVLKAKANDRRKNLPLAD
ncbi:uncharacterized protein TNCV_4933271 [Trichonephila clavipes]|nr:uncharacterized protein TNCV_4933271 [Trichonephila clavipes]